MKLQKEKWYVCIKSWSDDGWCKFEEGDLLKCEYDDELTDCYGITHLFVDDEVELTFREASLSESSIARSMEIDINEFVEDVGSFDPTETLADIYRKGAEDILRRIKSQLSITYKED